MRKALIVFAKQPRPGQVKTRLTTLLTQEEAATLYRAFLADALLQYTALDVDVRLHISPAMDREEAEYVPDAVAILPQKGSDLGARMKLAFVETFAAGYDRAVIIGTDHPTLPSPFITRAFDALDQRLSFCLGPSDDGGFYLMGMNDYYPQVFQNMAYSHADVFQNTLARAMTTRATITILPPWYDVDTPEALRQLVSDLRQTEDGARHTRSVVADLLRVYPDLRDD